MSCTSSTMSAITRSRCTRGPRARNPPSAHRINRIRMIVQSICHYLLRMVFRRRHASTMPLPSLGWTSVQTAKDAPFLRGVLLLRWAKSRLRLGELASNHTAAVQGRVEVHVIAGGVRHDGGD